jgi:hypothetical protein
MAEREIAMSRSFYQNRRRTWVVGINKSGKVVYREIAMGGKPKADDLMPFAVFPLCGKPTKSQMVNLWLAGVMSVVS